MNCTAKDKVVKPSPFLGHLEIFILFTTYAIDDFFRTFIASFKHEGGWENSRQLCKPEAQSKVCITFENSIIIKFSIQNVFSIHALDNHLSC